MAKRWVAVEQHDGAECEPCDAIDGTVYRNRADAYEDYPGGVGYKDCVGVQFGNSCRGRVQKRRGGERSDSSMTDSRVLAEFQNRLTERAALQPKMGNQGSARKPEPGADWFKIQNLSAAEAEIHIFDEIGMWGTTAQSFVDQLNAITAPKITVYLNSYGGEVFDGIAIHTALAMSKAHVTTFVTGVAASAASFIAMAGDTIKMARNATMMIHDASGLAWGNATAMRAQADLLDKLSLNIADMYAMQAGGTAAEWFARMENSEIWYTGQEALAAGLVDEITDPDTEPAEMPAPSNQLSLATFAYTGRAEAPPPPSTPAVEETTGEEESSTEDTRTLPDDPPDLEDEESLLAVSEQNQAMLLLAAFMKG